MLKSTLFSLCFLAIAIPPLARADGPIPQLPDAVKQAASIGSDQNQQISSAVGAVVKDLSDGSNPTAQSADRDWLVKSTLDSTANAGSAAFLHAYAQAVNDKLLAMVSAPNANFRAKIQAGFAAANIAAKSQGTELVPLATALLRDSSGAVVLVGMKAAHAMMPAILAESQLAQADQQLLDVMSEAVTAHPQPPLGGLIVQEAYQSLQEPVLQAGGAITVQTKRTLIPLVFKLTQQRLNQYKNSPPDNPDADSTGLVILFDRDIWSGNGGNGGLNQDQQVAAVKIALEHITETAKWAQTARAKGKLDSAPFIEALQTDGKELQLFSDPNTGVDPDQSLYTAVSDLVRLGPGSGPNTISNAAAATTGALRDYAKSKFGAVLVAGG